MAGKTADVRLVEISGQAQTALTSLTSAVTKGTGLGGGGGGGKGGGVQAAIGEAASGPIGALNAALGPLAVAAGTVAVAFKAVSLASPGTMERLNLAFEDTLAVVGQFLVPVFEVLGSVIKTVGDVLATIMPPASSLREILQPIGDMFRELMEALTPVFVIIKDVLVVALKALAIAIQVVLLPFKLLAQIITTLFGGEQEKLKDSRGTAVRNISFTSQDAGLKSVYAAAYKSGQAPGQDKANIPGWLEKIHSLLDTISKFVKGIAEKMSVKGMTEGVGLGAGELGGIAIKKQGGLGGMADFEATRKAIVDEIKKNQNPGAKGLDDLRKTIDFVIKNEGHTPKNDALERQIADMEMKARRGIDGNAGGR